MPERNPEPIDRVHDAIHRHHELVFRIASTVVGDPEEAEDVAQETFLRLVEKPELLDQVESLKGWLTRVTVNVARSRARSSASRRRREESWERERTGDPQEMPMSPLDSEQQNALSRALAELAEDLRLPLLLRYREGMKYREIAEVLACPEGTVAKRLSTGKDRLRQALIRLGVGGLALETLTSKEGLAASQPVAPAGLEARLIGGVDRAMTSASSSGSLFLGMGLRSWIAMVVFMTGGAALWWLPDAETDGRLPPPASMASTTGAPNTSSSGGLRAPIEASNAPSSIGEIRTAPAKEGVLYGWIRDEGGRAIGGCRVKIHEDVTMELLAETSTNNDGYYEVGELSLFEKRGLGFPNPPSRPDRPKQVLTKQEDVPRHVDWKESRQFRGQSAVLNPDRFRIVTSHEGFRPETKTARPMADNPRVQVDFQLRAGRILRGLVRSGQPLAGVEVKVVAAVLEPEDEGLLSFGESVTHRLSDASGSFEFDSLAKGSFLLRFSKSGYIPQEQWSDGESQLLVDLEGEAPLEIEVWHGPQNMPIAGALAVLSSQGRRVESLSSNEEGRVTFGGLPPGDYRVSVYKDNVPLASNEMTLTRALTHRERFVLDDGLALKGRVVFDDQGYRVMRVHALMRGPELPRAREVAYIDRSGRFEITSLAPAEYDVILSAGGKGSPPRVVSRSYVDLRRGVGEDVLLKMNENLRAELVLTVLDERDERISTSSVRAYHRSSGLPDAQGTAGGPWTLSLYPEAVRFEVNAKGYEGHVFEFDVLEPRTRRTHVVRLARKEESLALPSTPLVLTVKERISFLRYLEGVERQIGIRLELSESVEASLRRMRLHPWKTPVEMILDNHELALQRSGEVWRIVEKKSSGLAK